jgi:hypothetical protein
MYKRVSVDRAGNILEERGLGFTVCVAWCNVSDRNDDNGRFVEVFIPR